MPANVAHMLIAHKALRKLKAKGVPEYTAFAEMLDDPSPEANCKAYLNLGSIGPDLYYYSSKLGSVIDMIKEGFVRPKGVTPWSYHLHSQRPNEFPLRLVEVLFSDVVRKKGTVKLEAEDVRKLAYIAGHLCHIAADQIIHPVVNSCAGPYYRSGENRKEHRTCEVFQDYFLYQEVYRLEQKTGEKYDFFKQDFRSWIDCARGPGTRNTHDWFRYFLQRGFVECYGMCPSEKSVENSVDNLLLTLRICRFIGPYRTAAREYRADEQKSAMFVRYVKDLQYLRYYRLAVELSVIYLIALYEVYFALKEAMDFTPGHKKRFLSIVSDADLSCPLEQKIYEKAKAQLRTEHRINAALRTHALKLARKTRLVTRTRLFTERSPRTVVTA